MDTEISKIERQLEADPNNPELKKKLSSLQARLGRGGSYCSTCNIRTKNVLLYDLSLPHTQVHICSQCNQMFFIYDRSMPKDFKSLADAYFNNLIVNGESSTINLETLSVENLDFTLQDSYASGNTIQMSPCEGNFSITGFNGATDFEINNGLSGIKSLFDELIFEAKGFSISLIKENESIKLENKSLVGSINYLVEEIEGLKKEIADLKSATVR